MDKSGPAYNSFMFCLWPDIALLSGKTNKRLPRTSTVKKYKRTQLDIWSDVTMVFLRIKQRFDHNSIIH